MSRDLDSLAEVFTSKVFDRATCVERLQSLEEAEAWPRSEWQAAEERIALVRAIGAARRAEGRDAEAIRAVLRALNERGIGRSDVYSSRLFDALFGAPGRNSFFDIDRSISHALPGAPYEGGPMARPGGCAGVR